jgi:predicted hotdog family 3-hydroxylacyl-ACP dehydratase
MIDTEPNGTINFPLPIYKLARYVPHRQPMIWVDEVTRASEQDGECRVILKADSLYMDGEFIRPTSFVEWMAQSFAFVRATLAHRHHVDLARPVTEAFLVGIRDAKFEIDPTSIRLGEVPSLLVRVSNFRNFGPIISFDGEVILESGARVMKASIKVYQQQDTLESL